MKMKRCILIMAVCVSVVLLFAFAGQAKELRVVGSWSNQPMFKEYEKPFWTKTLPEALGGKIETKMTSLGEVGLKGAAVLRQLSQGVFDVVHTVADYVVSDSPALAGLDLPALAPDIETARKISMAYWPVAAQYIKKDFNGELLSIAPYPAQVLFCRDEISGLQDLKGKKVRASGWTAADFVDALGATGVTMNFAEVPQALQRGVVDCGITGSLSGYYAGWGDVTEYLFPLPMGGWDLAIGVMNMETWQSFTPDQQKTIKTLIKEKVQDPLFGSAEKQTEEGVQCLTGENCPYGKPAGLKLVKVTDKDIEKSREVLVDYVLPKWAERVGPEAVKQWNETIGKVVDLTAKP
jgi:TRAP-type C4-dicarboxylate transport system substrate-binding protein